MKKIINIILLVILSTPVFSQSCTQTGTCNRWRGAWTQYGDLGDYTPNKNEVAIFQSMKMKSKDNIRVVMVRQDMTYKNQTRYYVLYEVLDSEGNVRNRIARDLDTFKQRNIN